MPEGTVLPFSSLSGVTPGLPASVTPGLSVPVTPSHALAALSSVARVTSTTRSSSEAERVDLLREILGVPDERLRVFPLAIRQVVFANYARWVLPLVEQHWPECLGTAVDKKLRFAACNVYATAPYTVLFAAKKRPFVVDLVIKLGTTLRLKPSAMASLLARAVRWVARTLDDDTHRRIVQMSAFIATVDHVFDHFTEGMPVPERERRMKGLLDGSWQPDVDTPHRGAFLLVRALKDEMSRGVVGDDAVALQRALTKLTDWIESEGKAMCGVPDPTGACWRMAGVEGTIDGLIFPVHGYAGDDARAWMVSVSLFVQVMDDWIDLEKDQGALRPTPVITGDWDLATVRDAWARTERGIVELAHKSGLHDAHYADFVRETYRLMSVEVMEAMCGGTAA